MMPRWKAALLLATLLVWFVPFCAWVGFRREGARLLKDVPGALRWVVLGRWS